ncbi:hypothetical protein BRC94_05915 [Halobacteriales archaeon QS_5_70_17]|nr:MAG: hypothetical protein BRC94_05915 [Halobacteriales archaeon QS_5_70_17]
MTTISVAVPRKGRPLEAVLERLATHADATGLADDIISTLRYEKAITKGEQTADRDSYERLAAYSEGDGADYTLLRDERAGFPRRVVFDAATIPLGDHDLRLVGREEPFRALRKHEFALGFDSADLVLEEVVSLDEDPLTDIADVNDRIDPRDTDVRLITGLGDTVYHTLLATPSVADGPLDRSLVDGYEGPLCISPRYERLVEAVLGTAALDGVEFCYPSGGAEEEAAIAEAGLGVYVTVTGSTAREHGLLLGERLFPSETVLLENRREADGPERAVEAIFDPVETELSAPSQ